ncbi:P-type ATPase [Trinorchestia longiramus]|nr:P-type ATPase [Trinorchestia longiramus]
MPNQRISPDDELIESVGLYISRPFILHGYVFPFLFLYGAWAWFWIFVYGFSDYFEAGLIALSGIGCLQILACLFCHWSVHVRCLLTCRKVHSADEATVAKVVPLPNNGSPELVPLKRSRDSSGCSSLWFVFQKSKYVWEGEERKQFVALHFPIDRPLREYMDWKGYSSEEQLRAAQEVYGSNSLVMDVPEFMELFKERATAPFFVFQVFCVGLWCLDEYWYYSLFTLLMLIIFECTLVQQQLRNMQEIRKMGNKPCNIQVGRKPCSIQVGRKPWSIQVGRKPWSIQVGRKPWSIQVGRKPCSIQVGRKPCSIQVGRKPRSIQVGRKPRSIQVGRKPCNIQVGRKPCSIQVGRKPCSIQVGRKPCSIQVGCKPCSIKVHRLGKWRSILSSELLPGDIVSVSRGSGAAAETIVPCDLLLLRGPAVLDESMLTGESVPQMKESLEGMELGRPLDLTVDGKLHVLFGGTKLVQHTPPQKTQAHLKAPDNGVICYVLRTSFGSSQGRLLRTILYSVSRVTANNLETFIFILFLLVFAIAAAAYVWIKGCEDPERNRYKLFLECTLILTSVVPPELPIELSLAVNTSLLSLARLLVYCTEPFRIPFAGKVEVCCFDKTGTLTSDDLVVEGIAGLDGSSAVVPIVEAPLHTIHVAAVCHSLVNLDDTLVGDPMEKATLSAIDWTLTKASSVVPRKGKGGGLKIVQRYHFSSQLKRMSVVASCSQSGTADFVYMAAVKGAPETIRSMLVSVPRNYDKVYLELSRRGARVLALARKELGALSPGQVRDLNRQKVESGLNFQGFIIISCPLKRDSLDVIREVQASSHATVMITGDNPLTACHVARELQFTRNSTMLVLERDEEASEEGDRWVWRSIDQAVKLPLVPQMSPKDMKIKFFCAYDFCITGEGLTQLRSQYPIFWQQLLPYVRVFARVAPKQKELVITSYKDLGITTLMCGDGTNDVGALKHAPCGVAILSNAPDRPPSKKKKPEESSTVLSPAANEKLEAAKKLARKMDKRNPGGAAAALNTANSGQANQRLSHYQAQQQKTAQQLQKLLQELDEEQQQMVKLGDASIAAPFTSKLSSIQCVVHIIKQGRCTLVTTLQMFKILALNALILAYSQSVLYLDGIKFSDYQATLQGLLLAACFLFISRSKPLRTLSRERPLPNIFNVYTILTVLLQFSVHFACLYVLVQQANIFEPRTEKKVDLEKSFEPSLLNSTVYIISMTLQISTFAINYRGHPYMESLRENRALLVSLLCTGGLVMALAMGIIPQFAEQFEIVDFPPEFRKLLVQVLIADVSMSFLVDRICLFLFGEGKLRPSLRH